MEVTVARVAGKDMASQHAENLGQGIVVPDLVQFSSEGML